jgi:hypothetical protein
VSLELSAHAVTTTRTETKHKRASFVRHRTPSLVAVIPT